MRTPDLTPSFMSFQRHVLGSMLEHANRMTIMQRDSHPDMQPTTLADRTWSHDGIRETLRDGKRWLRG